MSFTNTIEGPATRLFPNPNARVPSPKWHLGLDLGERQDHSALVVLDTIWEQKGRCHETYGYKFAPVLTIRSMERFPLNTGYQNVPRIVGDRVRQIEERQRTSYQPADIELIVDAGGPGGPMVDMLRATAPNNVKVLPVMITSGAAESSLSGGFHGVPRRDLITRLIQMMTSGCLQCPAAMPNATIWQNELLSLGGSNTHPGRASEHDDITVAAALAAWAAARSAPELNPATQAKRIKYGFIDKPLF